jgi:ATP-dependent exoDNAse (exonuclease V) beta subunit
MISEIHQRLTCFNDPQFKFDPQWHRYTYNGKKYTSVTTFLKNFHKPFDEEYWSKKKSDDLGVPQDWLLKEWKDKNIRANEVGTSLHNYIENYFNQIYQPLPTDLDVIDRINKFNKIFATHLYKLQPIQFELRLFSKKYPIAGTIDSIFLYNGKLFILDWKTNGEFKHDDHPKGRYNKLLSPFDDFYENHLNEYSIQVSFYALILEEWGFDIRGGYLVHFGPDSEAQIYKSQDMRDKLKSYLDTYNFN